MIYETPEYPAPRPSAPVDVGARLPVHLLVRLDEVARARRWSRSQAIVAAVEQFVDSAPADPFWGTETR